MIRVENLTKIYRTPKKSKNFLADIFFRQYKDKVALDNVSFEIGKNELVGFIGPNGAGKTTTLKILAGILYPTRGSVRVLGHNPFDKKIEFLRQIAFVMGQRNQLIWELPAIDTFLLNKEIYGISDSDFDGTLKELTLLLRGQELVDRPVKTLSLGERMKMELIAGLIHRPKLIFFDEPTIGLDIFSQEAIRDFIKQFQSRFESTVILTSHYLEDIKRLAKHLIIINEGKIVYNGTIHQITDKYSSIKYINVTLDREVDPKIINKIEEPTFFQFPRLTWTIDKRALPEKIALINKLIPYTDLTIEEEKIEAVIKKLFSAKKPV